MKISINEDSKLDDIEIIINCKQTDEQVMKILSSLNSFDKRLTGMKDGQSFILLAENILYIESVDKKAFIYYEKDVYESSLRLYELEERLNSNGFFRASKSSIVNLTQVKSLRPDLGGRLTITMNNKEKIIVSRQYAKNIKNELGL